MLLGFGGVSEYGITVRWDKNFLTIVYLTLARNRHVRIYGGVRFGGTITLDDAWALGFDHVAIAAGAGRPTIIDMKNNLVARHPQGERLPHGPAADGCLQAHEHREPAGEPARPSSSAAASRRSTRRPSSSPTTRCRSRRTLERYELLLRDAARRGRRPRDVRRRGVGDARSSTSTHGRAAPRREARAPRREGREPRRAEAPRRVGRRHARLPQGPRGLARVPPEPRGGQQEPRGGRALRRAHVAARGRARRPRRT